MMSFRQIVIVYSLILFLVFILGSVYLAPTIPEDATYTIICDDGTNETFNKTTTFVCGQVNPLIKVEEEKFEVKLIP